MYQAQLLSQQGRADQALGESTRRLRLDESAIAICTQDRCTASDAVAPSRARFS